MINHQEKDSKRENSTNSPDYKILTVVLPVALARGGGKTRWVGVGWLTRSLYLNKAQVAAEHKTTARKTERAIIAIMPFLSPPLCCCLFCMSTPMGFIVRPLFPSLEYGPSSIMFMLEGGKGGDGGKPIYRGPHKISRVMKRIQEFENLYIPG